MSFHDVKRIDLLLQRVAGKIMKQDKVNTVLLMDYIGHDSIANVILKEVPEPLREKTLAQTRLKQDHNILVLLVESDGFHPEAALATTIFRPGDRLTVFGRYSEISHVFQAEERFF